MTNQHEITIKEKMVNTLTELGLMSEGDKLELIIYMLLHGGKVGESNVREDTTEED